jgi:hypothetical protein
MSSVWVQLYYEGKEQPVGNADPIEIDPIPKNIYGLKEKVKDKQPNKLKFVDAGDLGIYPAGTVVPVSNATKALNTWDDVPTSSTGPTPLIVVVPKPEQPNGKLRCCSSILVFKS